MDIEIIFVLAVLGFGFLGYFLLQQDNHWSKVVGGTLTVLIILSIPTILFISVVLDGMSRSRYF